MFNKKLKRDIEKLEYRVFELGLKQFQNDSGFNDEVYFIDEEFEIKKAFIDWEKSFENRGFYLYVNYNDSYFTYFSTIEKITRRFYFKETSKNRIANTKKELEDRIKSKFCNKKLDK